MARLQLWLLTALLLIVGALCVPVQRHLQEVEVDDEQRAENVQEWLHDLPRYDWTLNSVSNTWEPTSFEYYQSITLIASPFLALGVITFVFGLFLSTIGFCCIKCIPSNPKGYGRICRWIPAALILFLLLILLLFLGFSFYFEYSYHNSFKDVVDSGVDLVQYESNLVDETIFAAESYNGTYNEVITLPPYLDEWQTALDNATSTIETGADDVAKPIENVRHSFVLVGLIVFVVMCLLAALGAICLFGCSSTCVISMALTCATFCWICLFLNVTEAVFIADMCPEIDNAVDDKFPEDIQPYSNYYLYCEGDPTELFTPLPESIEAALAALDAGIAQAEASGNETMARNLSEDKEQVLELEDLVVSLMNCSTVMNAYDDMKEQSCVDLFNSLLGLSICLLLLALLVLPLVGLEVLGLRFWPHPKKTTDERDEERVIIHAAPKAAYKSTDPSPKRRKHTFDDHAFSDSDGDTDVLIF